MTLCQTHTYAIMKVSKATYDEIERLLQEAGYDHAIMEDGALDMHGIAIAHPQEDEDNEKEAG